MKVVHLALVLVVAFLCLADAQQDESIVLTQSGPVRGVVASTFRSFKGIPYSESPVGSLRLAPSIPKRPWGSSPYNATSFGPGCPQRCDLPPHMCPEVQSEDCLFLNVWTPRVDSISSPLPVIFFMPGGRFEQGEAASPVYNGEYMASQSGVILVTINYRLGALGYLVLQDGLLGNLGIKDQRLALEWVIKNIAAFGGNPRNITIMGESAGGTSVAVHLVSQYSQGLYARAIIESNPASLPLKTIPEAWSLARLLVDKLKCPWDNSTITCLRQKSVNDILNAQQQVENSLDFFHPLLTGMPWSPVIEGDELLGQPWQLLLSGKFNRVPILMGTVSEEAWPFIYQAARKPVSESLYILTTAMLYGIDMVSVLRRYPPGGFWDSSDYRPLLSELATDYLMVCLARAVASKSSALGVPTYLYQFNHSVSFNPWGNNYNFCVGHVCHGIELPFVFHSAEPLYRWTSSEADLSQNMVKYWTNFAKSGDPNKPVPVPAWPRYDAQTDQNMKLAVPPSIQTGLRAPYCDFWDSMGYNY